MLKIIEEENEIKKAQAQFRKKINDIAEKHGSISLGGKGWHRDREVYWNESLRIWWTMEEEEDRYWNSFGTGEPKWNTKYSHSIVVEINLPKGKNRRIQGAVASDESGKLYLLHRGRIGGGRKGIGKSLFVDNFRGEWETVWDGTATARLALIAALDSERFPQQVASFVHEVARVKGIKSTKAKSDSTVAFKFKEEFSGTKRFSQTKEIDAKCDHGIVVNNLAKKLESRGLAVGNTSQMDLYILDKHGEIEKLFEVKTDTTVRSCYEAIGQLFFHSSRLGAKPLLIAVFPHTIAKQYEKVFKKLGINVLTYMWSNNIPRFSNLKCAL